MTEIEIVPVRTDSITSLAADYVLLKNAAEGVFGPESSVNRAMGGLLQLHGTPRETALGTVQILRTDGAIAPGKIILVGVGNGIAMTYATVRLMSQKAIEALAELKVESATLATVSHAVGFGLDREEVLHAQLFGFRSALEANPSVRIAAILYNEIEDHDHRRIVTSLERLALDSDSPVRKRGKQFFLTLGTRSALAVSSAHRIERAATVFLAMPFSDEFENVYDFGLRLPLVEAGLLPIRLDKESFLGSISSEIKQRIRTASVVIADITGQNPNVLFELGFAQGCDKPTIVICRTSQELPFDVRDTKVLFYNPLVLRELNSNLRELLASLR